MAGSDRERKASSNEASALQQSVAGNSTAWLQGAIDAAAQKGGGKIEVPSGTYACGPVVLRSGVVVEGAGVDATRFVPLTGSGGPIFIIDDGPVTHVGLRSLSLISGSSSTEAPVGGAIEAKARSSGTHNDGGLWWSDFSDLKIQGFSIGISLKGGVDDYYHPNQFVTFNRVLIFLPKAKNAVALQLSGQTEHIAFNGCQFEGVGRDSGQRLVLIPPQVNGNGPILLTFRDCTFQNAASALEVEHVEQITVSESWFENLGRICFAGPSAKMVMIQRSRFANARGSGSLLGGDGAAAVRFQDCALRERGVSQTLSQ